jgi:siroheme synthase (precorrin-2 oxidase/ferrochelatase)
MKRHKSGDHWGTFISADTFMTLVAIVHDAGLVIAVSANSATPEAEAATKLALKQLLTRYGGKAGG